MRRSHGPICCVAFFLWLAPPLSSLASSLPVLSNQQDGSLIVSDSHGAITEFVKQGTPRQSIQIGGQNCNVSFGLNSAGKKTILISVPTSASRSVIFQMGTDQITVPPKSALRVTLNSNNQVEKLDGNPADTVKIEAISSPENPGTSPSPLPSTSQKNLTPAPLPDLPQPQAISNPESSPSSPSPDLSPPMNASSDGHLESSPAGWPGKYLGSPIPENLMEEDSFYFRTEFGPRFMSAMNLISVSGPGGNYGILNEKKIAFSTGYRQDLDVGVWLTDWFGLAVETGFALNAVRGNTEGMTVTSTTFWTVPLLAQLCFQYPNDSGWTPYVNFGFGGGWTLFKVGGLTYSDPSGTSIPASLSGTGNSVNNAYQISAGVRYRLYEQLSFTMAYKFYGNSQATVNLDNGVQATLGSPVTQSAELGLNFSF